MRRFVFILMLPCISLSFHIQVLDRTSANLLAYDYIRKESVMNTDTKKELLHQNILQDLTQCVISTSETNMNNMVQEEFLTLCTPQGETVGLCVQERIYSDIYYKHIVIDPEIYHEISDDYSKLLCIFFESLKRHNYNYNGNTTFLNEYIKLELLFMNQL